MKKQLTLLVLFTICLVKAQCPAPSNITVYTPYPFAAELGWTENGSALLWEVMFVADYVIGSPPPATGWILVASNPILLTNLPQGCLVYYIRSRCSATEFSDWALKSSWECDANVFAYIASLNNHVFSGAKELQLYPNPASKVLQLKTNAPIDKILITDLAGKVVLVQTQNNNEVNIESLSRGMYLLEVFSGEAKLTEKFIKE